MWTETCALAAIGLAREERTLAAASMANRIFMGSFCFLDGGTTRFPNARGGATVVVGFSLPPLRQPFYSFSGAA
jgi:hypothetical protein